MFNMFDKPMLPGGREINVDSINGKPTHDALLAINLKVAAEVFEEISRDDPGYSSTPLADRGLYCYRAVNWMQLASDAGVFNDEQGLKYAIYVLEAGKEAKYPRDGEVNRLIMESLAKALPKRKVKIVSDYADQVVSKSSLPL